MPALAVMSGSRTMLASAGYRSKHAVASSLQQQRMAHLEQRRRIQGRRLICAGCACLEMQKTYRVDISALRRCMDEQMLTCRLHIGFVQGLLRLVPGCLCLSCMLCHTDGVHGVLPRMILLHRQRLAAVVVWVVVKPAVNPACDAMCQLMIA